MTATREYTTISSSATFLPLRHLLPGNNNNNSYTYSLYTYSLYYAPVLAGIMYATIPPESYALYAGTSIISIAAIDRMTNASERIMDVLAESPELTCFAAGGCGGAVSRTCTAPLDRLKILAQEGRVAQFTMPHPTIQRRPRGHCDRELMNSLVRYVMLYEGGVKGFWRGNGVNCLKAGPEYATAFMARQYYVDNWCKNSKSPTFLENTVVGAAGGATAQLIWYPLELVKQRMAASKTGEYTSIADCFVQSASRGGVRDLYTGCGANLAGIIPHRGLEMGMYFSLQQSCATYYGGVAPMWATTLIGFTASVFAQLMTYPLNLARTRLQTQGVNGRPVRYKGLSHCLFTVFREEGPRGLFAGILPNMLKAVPASVIMYNVFSWSQARIQAHKEEKKRKQ